MKNLKIAKYVSKRPSKIGKRDHTKARYFVDQSETRLYERLERNKEFIFFPGSDEDRKRATKIIHDLLNRASNRCMLLDPYFGAVDIEYALVVSNLSVPIQIISSASFLIQKINKDDDSPTNARELLNVLLQYKKHYSRQKIDCRVLKGNDKSPLHDRYIIVDENAYLLGSSFNDFGSRATTLVKIPAPQQMIRQAVEWWNDADKTILLEDFVNIQKQKMKDKIVKEFEQLSKADFVIKAEDTITSNTFNETDELLEWFVNLIVRKIIHKEQLPPFYILSCRNSISSF